MLGITPVKELGTMESVPRLCIFDVFIVEFIQPCYKLVKFDLFSYKNSSSNWAKFAEDAKAIVAILQGCKSWQTCGMILFDYKIYRQQSWSEE